MGIRIGAWAIDSLILIVFQLVFWMFAFAIGALRINPAAQNQMETAPLTLPTVAPYRANLSLLAVLLALFVVLNVVYAAVCWARLRGMPGQRILSLQVGAVDTGRNLGIGPALLRAVAALGIPLAAVAGVFYGVFAFETSVPWSDVIDPQPGGPAEAWLSGWSGPLVLALLVAVMWPLALLIWTATSPTRAGAHDRLAGSLVVGKVSAPTWIASTYGPGYDPSRGMSGYGPPGYRPGYWAAPAAPPIAGNSEADQPEPRTATEPSSQPAMPAGPRNELLPGRRGGSDEEPVWSQGASDAPPKLQAATVGRRMAAYLFDCVLVYMILAVTASIAEAAFLPSSGAGVDERTRILFGLIGGLEQLAYFTAGWTVWRGTLAQRIMHLQVADATTGKPLPWLDAVVRWAVLQGPFALATIVPDAVVSPVAVAAAAWAAYLWYTTTNDPGQRGLHDRFVNSRVDRES
jgi:uncharacterized RDD family membrane protein YckC